MSESPQSAVSPPRSCTPTATRRSSTARCTSRCTCRSPTATATRASSPRCSRARRRATSYGRQGNPTAAALEEKVTRMEDGVATVCFAHRHGRDRRDHARAAARGRSRRRELVPVRQHQQPVRHAGGARRRGELRRRDRRRARSRRRSRLRRGSCSSRRSPIRARRSPTSRASASCARRAASSTSSTTR